jgi:hypothetical protein
MLLVDMCCLVGDLVEFFGSRLGFGENFVGFLTDLYGIWRFGDALLKGNLQKSGP